MANIYDISDWSGSTTYKKNEIVKYNNIFYYSLIESNVGNTPSVSSIQWGGRSLSPVTNQELPNFIWAADYGINLDISPKIKTINFGGYSQDLPDNINNSLLNIEAVFSGRDELEITAITHFIFSRSGVQNFLFTPPPPFSKLKLFRCNEMPFSKGFYNNNTIKLVFREVVA